MSTKPTIFDKYSDQFNFVVNFIDLPKGDLRFFARGYKASADTLAENIIAKDLHFRDYELYPIVFLYRHSLELYLKALVYHSAHAQRLESLPAIAEEYSSHALVQISIKVQGALKIVSDNDTEVMRVVSKAVQVANDFEKKDRVSFSYRYPITKDGGRSTDDRHQTMNLRALHEEMSSLLDELDTLADWLDHQNLEREELQDYLRSHYGDSGTF